jgi:FlaA1/EpsC-like NDP-sugar epimerase
MESPLGRSILLTGGAGFLGRAIIDRAHREDWDCRITVYSRDEEKQYKVKERWPGVRCILGAINDVNRLTEALDGHETLLHLAAHKFVPEAEHAVQVAIDANVNGTMSAATAATMTRVKTAVFISTDKACMPRNVYGMTKALGERIWSERYTNAKHTRFRAVRYGNVIGSTGSVLPIFVNKIKRGERPQLTNPKMTRFYMSVDRAVDTIIAGYNTEHFMTVPQMNSADLLTVMGAAMIVAENHGIPSGSDAGTAFKYELGRDMWKLPFDIIGERGGEKIHEQLISLEETTLVQDAADSFTYLTTETDKRNHLSVKPDYAVSSEDVPRLQAEALASIHLASEQI